MPIPSMASARSRLGVVSRGESPKTEDVFRAHQDLNAAVIKKLITERTIEYGISPEHARELKALIDDSTGVI